MAKVEKEKKRKPRKVLRDVNAALLKQQSGEITAEQALVEINILINPAEAVPEAK